MKPSPAEEESCSVASAGKPHNPAARAVLAVLAEWARAEISRRRGIERCRVAPEDCSPGALAGSGQGDFHHPALPLMCLAVRHPRSELQSEVVGVSTEF